MARGLSSDQKFNLLQDGNTPKTQTLKGNSEEIFRGSILSWDTSDAIVCKQAPSSSEMHQFMGMAKDGTDDGAGKIVVFEEFILENKIVDGSPEPGIPVFLKTRKLKQSDNPFQAGETIELTGYATVDSATPAVVTGLGTKFTEEFNVGDTFYLDGEIAYAQVITAIASDTSMTLTGAYGGIEDPALTGTGTFSATGTALVAVGGAFLTELYPGSKIWNSDSDTIADAAVVKSITDNDNIVLEAPYTGTAAAGANMAVAHECSVVQVSELTTAEYEEYTGVKYYNLPVGFIEKIHTVATPSWNIRFSKSFAAAVIPSASFVSADNIDTAAAGDTLSLGKSNAAVVEIGKSAGTTDIKSSITIKDAIDLKSAGALKIGNSTATSVEVGKTGQDNDMKGPVDAEEGIKVDDINGRTAGPLTIGASTSTSVELGAVGTPTVVLGNNEVAGNNEVTGDAITAKNVGVVSPAGTVVAAEYGDSHKHVTQLTLTDFIIGQITPAATKAVGNLLYTFPAGKLVKYTITFNLTISRADGFGGATVDTPDVGIGSKQADGGASLTLDLQPVADAGKAEDYLDGQTWIDLDNPQEAGPLGATAGMLTGISLDNTIREIYLNAAGAFVTDGALDTPTNLLATGTITINWDFMG